VSASSPHARIPVGVVVERRKATSPWADVIWRPVAVLPGLPDAAPWTVLSAAEGTATFYLGGGAINLYRTDTEYYRSNLASETPSVWVALRSTGVDPPYRLFAVTADPAEGESFTQAGSDLVDAVPMPAAVREAVAAFVAEHHVDRPFYRRQRDRAGSGALAPRGPTREDRDE
jgi:hypothetical protein